MQLVPQSKTTHMYYDLLVNQKLPFHRRKGSVITNDSIKRMDAHSQLRCAVPLEFRVNSHHLDKGEASRSPGRSRTLHKQAEKSPRRPAAQIVLNHQSDLASQDSSPKFSHAQFGAKRFSGLDSTFTGFS